MHCTLIELFDILTIDISIFVCCSVKVLDEIK